MPVFRPRSLSSCVFLLALLGSASPLLAQPASVAPAPRPMTLVDLLSLPGVQDPQLSPDGRHVLFVQDAADWKANRRIGHLHRIDITGENQVQLTYGERGESSPRWAPDGRRIAFLARRDQDASSQIYLLDIDGGEARRLTTHPTQPGGLQWAPDGRSIYFIASDAPTADDRERQRLQDDVYRFEENWKHRHLWRVGVDGVAQQVTTGDFSVWSYAISEDGRLMAMTRAPGPILEYGEEQEVWVMNAADGAGARQLTDNRIGEGNVRLSPDGTQVLFTATANERFEPYYNDKIFVMPVAGGAARVLMAAQAQQVLRAEWSKDGGAIYFVANVGVTSHLARVDAASEEVTVLTSGDHSLQGWQFVASADRHVFHVDEPTRFGDIWTLAAAPGAVMTRVTSVFDAVARDFAIPRQERVTWKGRDGETVEGLVYYPIGYTAGRRYPLVVNTHGGPADSDKFGFSGWNSFVQVLAARGYAVFKPNYRGSTGYGDRFLRDMVGHYFNEAPHDVLLGVDHLVAIGLADPDRLVKTGWSAGGHLTNRIVTMTNRFKAASSGAGVANWLSLYAQSDMRTNRTPWFGGTPWQQDAPIDTYWNQSPLKDVSRITTPILFIVGEVDARVPLPQSVEMYRGVKAQGVPTALYVAPREPHNWVELRHRLFKMNVELEWFEKYAGAREYVWEKAPVEGNGPATRAAGRTAGQFY
jgi:dipeptidyl aminopeptidase/acylaminoacyl peptidase